ncbi:MAG: CARDB domain-containing protein [Halobacteriota archaeon]
MKKRLVVVGAMALMLLICQMESVNAESHKPDLTIIEKSEEWVNLTNKTYNITYTIKNIGNATANASITHIYIGNVSVNDTVEALAPSKTYRNTLGPFALSRNNDTIRICGDANTTIEETHEENNCVENVLKASPDLVIVEKSEDWVDFDNMRYNVTYTIMNSGVDTANVSVTCIYVDNILVVTDTVEALAPGENYISMFGPFAISGDYDTITICADVNNTVEESNEENNCVENVFKIGPDIVVEEKREEWIDLINMRYNVTYTIRNKGTETANASMINICIDNASAVVNDSIRGLAPGENYTNTVGPFTMTGKSDGIKICVDSTDIISESREENSCVQNVLEYPGIPDLIIIGLPEEGIARANRTYNTMPYRVRNVGDGVAGPSKVSIKINGIEKVTEFVGVLAQGENYTSAVGHFSTSRCNDVITICADRENVVSERNEENNCIERILVETLEETPAPTEAPKIPGFGLVFALVGLLAIAYLLMLRRRGER